MGMQVVKISGDILDWRMKLGESRFDVNVPP
jgi:hypothetical protein